jgi:protein O-mannosyl-transferase
MNSAVGIIFCLGILVYSNTFLCSFHFDDLPSIVGNLSIRNIHHLQAIWNFLPRRFILYLSIALNYHFNGLNVFGYHLFNLAVHLVSAVLVWWLTILTFSTPAMKGQRIASHAGIIALFAGLVFVAHPIQTQAVTYIVQRAASMAAMFYLASLCLYVKSRCHCERSEAIFYTGSFITAILAMFTKETAITLPLMILLYEYCFLEINWRRAAPFLLTIFIIPITMLLTETGAARLHQLQSEPGISSIHYLLTQFRVMLTYVRLVFLPIHQNVDYDYPVFKSIFELPVLTGLIFLMAIFYCAKRLFSKYRLVSFSIFWFFLTLLPESSLLPIKDVIYEHRLYLPMVGFSIFLVSSMYYVFVEYRHSESEGRRISRYLIALTMIIACYSVLTYERNKVWKDEFTLWDDTIQKSPHKPRAYINRALARYDQGDLAQAMSDYNKAIETDPNYPDAYYNRGLEYYRQGELPQAFSDFNKVIEIDPGFADAYNNRGLVYFYQGSFSKAISDYSKAIAINPDYAGAYNNRAIVYYRLRQYDKAWGDVRKAQGAGFTVNPGFLSALSQAGRS